ncbi:F-box domain containing protein [Pandoravirus salinus]|uniref:F-box domain containing protein n=1 Tax=Pandoravirus salinus TaxID=1349410 RepID=S4VSI3_9VIRU|nr:F-box domain [Pandoravirus salinus]AGO83364.1 F-box domain containing protein [Pandoravirus salinus]
MTDFVAEPKALECADLPNELWTTVLSHAERQAVLAAARTCRRISACALDDALWALLYRRDLGDPDTPSGYVPIAGTPWRVAYACRALQQRWGTRDATALQTLRALHPTPPPVGVGISCDDGPRTVRCGQFDAAGRLSGYGWVMAYEGTPAPVAFAEGQFVGDAPHGRCRYRRASHRLGGGCRRPAVCPCEACADPIDPDSRPLPGICVRLILATYEGQWVYGVRSGTGEASYRHARKEYAHYAGQWADGRWHGHGKYTLGADAADPTTRIGDFVAGRSVGTGVATYGRRFGLSAAAKVRPVRFEGTWAPDATLSAGKMTFSDGRTFEGTFRNCAPACGVFLLADRSTRVVGHWGGDWDTGSGTGRIHGPGSTSREMTLHNWIEPCAHQWTDPKGIVWHGCTRHCPQRNNDLGRTGLYKATLTNGDTWTSRWKNDRLLAVVDYRVSERCPEPRFRGAVFADLRWRHFAAGADDEIGWLFYPHPHRAAECALFMAYALSDLGPWGTISRRRLYDLLVVSADVVGLCEKLCPLAPS